MPGSNGGSVPSFVFLLPYLEQQALYQQIQMSDGYNSTSGPGSPFATPLPVLVCPSDSGLSSPAVVQDLGTNYYFGMTSYRPNSSGLSYFDLGYDTDGVMMNHFRGGVSPINILAITDGTSNTILFGEFSNFDPNWPQYQAVWAGNPFFPANLSRASSVYTCWPVLSFVPEASGYYSLNTPLPSPPSTDIVTAVGAIVGRCATYGSGHTQGANFVFCDGSVHFLSNAINNAAVMQPSGNTLLQALSTRAGGEVVDGSQY
jgi:prepilin-type processing-associated H-X9-DG protein